MQLCKIRHCQKSFPTLTSRVMFTVLMATFIYPSESSFRFFSIVCSIPKPVGEKKTLYLREIFGNIYFILFFNFTILYWFCHISKWIRHRYTCVPHPEPSSLLIWRRHPLNFSISPLISLLTIINTHEGKKSHSDNICISEDPSRKQNSPLLMPKKIL